MSRVLIVEDDRAIVSGLKLNLRYEGHQVAVARDGEGALQAVAHEPPELVLLDVMLPGMDGFAVLHALRRSGYSGPVLMLTARGMEEDKVRGLASGADDYVTKPFGVRELMARVQALLRRAPPQRREISFGQVTIDLSGHRVTRAGQDVPLTPQEFRLLALLVENEGHAFRRQALLDGAWDDGFEVGPRTVDNFVRQLRSKLEEDPERPRHFVTVRGTGYRFQR